MKNLLQVGDVIKTQPIAGFWACSVVLAFQPKSEDFSAMCLIGCTDGIFRHDFAFSDLKIDSLKIAVGVMGMEAGRKQLKVYAAKIYPGVEVIGTMDVSRIFPASIEFRVIRHDMPPWPLCGKTSSAIGNVAVSAWRSVHDREQWLLDLESSRVKTAALFEQMRAKERERRKKKKADPVGTDNGGAARRRV